MIHMSQVKVPVEKIIKAAPPELVRHGIIGEKEELLVRQAAAKQLRIAPEKIKTFCIERKSMDARKKQQMHYTYRVTLICNNEEQLVRRYGKNDVQWEKGMLPERSASQETEMFLAKNVPSEKESITGAKVLTKQDETKRLRPVVVGFGPAGIFAALELAKAGLAPIVIERGEAVEERKQAVDAFWNGGTLNPESNVQFGEGGAGAFSDGKLNTLVKDNSGRNQQVLRTFVEFGAPAEILYLQKPHIGTDRLTEVVKAIREKISSLGGEIWFRTRLENIVVKDGSLCEILLDKAGEKMTYPCERLVLATGHSARDTFYNLRDAGLFMEPKAFAIGVRVEHSQEMIGRNQYGEYYDRLPTADYKVTCQTSQKRGVYSFCMCPGGYVVNASSEEGRLAINGMSYYNRNGINANSAIVVTVSPEDFGSSDALAGVEFQRRYERAAFLQAEGKIPVQLFADYLQNRVSTGFGSVVPQMKGAYAFGNVREILPVAVGDAIAEGMQLFDKRLKGYAAEDTVLSGIESRTSSPVRMVRDESMQANIAGIYPCGEGAGYAGGITSAAMDGMKVAEAIIQQMALR